MPSENHSERGPEVIFSEGQEMIKEIEGSIVEMNIVFQNTRKNLERLRRLSVSQIRIDKVVTGMRELEKDIHDLINLSRLIHIQEVRDEKFLAELDESDQ